MPGSVGTCRSIPLFYKDHVPASMPHTIRTTDYGNTDIRQSLQETEKMILDGLLRLRSTTSSPSAEPNRHHELKQEEQSNTCIERDQTPNYLLKIKDLPPWADPNPHILTSYRASSNNTLTSLASIFSHWHNETANIHTHLVPAILLILILTHSTLYTYLVTKYGDRLTPFDWAIIVTQLLTATGCLLASTLYHTLLNHSERVAEVWLAVDYVGIIALTMGDFVSGLHFGFYCFPRVKFFYWGLVCHCSFMTMLLHDVLTSELDHGLVYPIGHRPVEPAVQKRRPPSVQSGRSRCDWAVSVRAHRTRMDPLGNGVRDGHWSGMVSP